MEDKIHETFAIKTKLTNYLLYETFQALNIHTFLNYQIRMPNVLAYFTNSKHSTSFHIS